MRVHLRPVSSQPTARSRSPSYGFGRRRSCAVFFGGIAVAGVVVAGGAAMGPAGGRADRNAVDRRGGQRPGDHAGTDDAHCRGRGHSGGVRPVQRGRVGCGRARLAGRGACRSWPACPVRAVRGFLVLVPVGFSGVVLAGCMSPAVEAYVAAVPGPTVSARSRLGPSRAVVRRLAGLFAVDAAGGGLVTAGFLSYYFTERYHVSVAALGWLFFAVSVVQAASVALAAAGPPVRPGRHRGRHPPDRPGRVARGRRGGQGRIRRDTVGLGTPSRPGIPHARCGSKRRRRGHGRLIREPS